MSSSILVYSTKLTPRVQFAFNLILRDILGLNVEFTQSEEDFLVADDPKLSYNFQATKSEINFTPQGLLFQKGIEQFEVSVDDSTSEYSFFKVNDSPISFDVFAASFYLATRYEEYLPHVKDKHGRYAAKNSLAYKFGFLDKPIINSWANLVKEILLEHFPTISFPKRAFKIEPTIDVDSAFAYAEKGMVRTIMGFGKDVLNRDFSGFSDRMSTIAGRKDDPYNVFDKLIELQDQFGWRFTYFFLVGDYDKNDRSIAITSQKFQALLKHVNDYSDVGLHPSFASNESTKKLAKELDRLSKTLHYPIQKSRQHFLKLHLPETYRNLMELGVKSEYSMGYPDCAGFRASICTPYYFYDLEQEVETNLKIHPFSLMEATYKYYQPGELEAALEKGLEIAKSVKEVDGTFSFVWHSDSISGMEPWKGWENGLALFCEKLSQL